MAEPLLLYRELQFRRVKLFTVADAREIDTMTLIMRATMNNQYLDVLKHQTRRGMRGVVESGRSGGGCPYGYLVDDSHQKMTRRGWETEHGHLKIDPAQAEIVQRIFHEFGILGLSPLAIVRRLNAEGVPSPGASYRRTRPRLTPWNPSTLRGGFVKQNGILRNSIYIGQRTWNRMEFRVNPSVGRRVGFVGDATELVTSSVPQLRIVDDVVWHAAQARLAAMRTASLVGARPERAKRPQYLLSGLAKCELCGASFVTKTRTELRCHNAVVTKTCRNQRVLRREVLEARVLTALKVSLLAEGGPFDAFCATVAEERARLHSTEHERREAATRALAEVADEIQRLIRAITRGVEGPEIQAEMQRLQQRKAALVAELDDQESAAVDLPKLDAATLRAAFTAAIAHLESLLAQADESLKAEARELLRSVVEKIEIPPVEGPVW